MAFVVSPVSRRGFLEVLGAGAISVSFAASTSRWALLSDTHIPTDPANEYRGFKPFDNLTSVVPAVNRFAPDGMLITGDLAREEGLASDYVALKSILQPLTERMPIAFALGNHDDRENFVTGFAATAAGERADLNQKCVSILGHAPVRFIVLDSLAFPHYVPGLLGKQQRDWLDSYLAASPDTPSLLFVHHTLDDGDGSLLDFERLLAIAQKHRQAKAIFYGHSHLYRTDTVQGLHLVNLPAVGYNFRDTAPVGWVQAVFSPEGAQLTLQAIGGNTSEHGKTRSLAWR
jgi:3',5'-cyclic-AMP phosphodiesterase